MYLIVFIELAMPCSGFFVLIEYLLRMQAITVLGLLP